MQARLSGQFPISFSVMQSPQAGDEGRHMTDSLPAALRPAAIFLAAILLGMVSTLTGCGGGEGSAPDTGGADPAVVPDASSGEDATVSDGGVESDAVTSDAVTSDAGPPDAGGTDAASVPDASSDEDATIPDGDVESDADSSDAGAPDAGQSDADCPATETVLALRQLQWGEGNSGEWKGYGFDLDGLSSTALSTDVCQPNSGGSAVVVYPDGNAGIDNAFGKNILPSLLALIPTFASDTQTRLDHGDFTTLLEPLCLPPTGDVPVLGARLFDTLPLGATPAWDGTDVWPVDPWLLSDPTDSASSTLFFPAGSVTGATFDAGTGGTFVLSLPLKSTIGSTFMRLTLHAARITMTLSGDRTSATSGRLGGVLDTEELVAEVKKVGKLVGVCGSPVLDSFLTSVRQASDIMGDGTQDPSGTCDGISIGLGFEMGPAQRGDVAPAQSAAPTCP